MRNRDFRIADITRKEIALSLPVFQTDKGIGSIFLNLRQHTIDILAISEH